MVKRRHFSLLSFTVGALFSPRGMSAQTKPWQARLPQDIAHGLMSRVSANSNGAIGRNRNGYVHARFQYGLHALADHAVCVQSRRSLGLYFKCLNYALAEQTKAGDFRSDIPFHVSLGASPSRADLASACSFFFASACAGWLALFRAQDSFTPVLHAESRSALMASRPKLELGLRYLLDQKTVLLAADARAPNRLLIDALAFHCLGHIANDPSALRNAEEFLSAALSMQHQDGYIIEGSGYDSSYNGVAIAVGYRALLSGMQARRLSEALMLALAWQKTRISAHGEISSHGNSRVFNGGESFMGQEKRLDVAHTVEAFALGFVAQNDESLIRTARKIAANYGKQRKL